MHPSAWRVILQITLQRVPLHTPSILDSGTDYKSHLDEGCSAGCLIKSYAVTRGASMPLSIGASQLASWSRSDLFMYATRTFS